MATYADCLRPTVFPKLSHAHHNSFCSSRAGEVQQRHIANHRLARAMGLEWLARMSNVFSDGVGSRRRTPWLSEVEFDVLSNPTARKAAPALHRASALPGLSTLLLGTVDGVSSMCLAHHLHFRTGESAGGFVPWPTSCLKPKQISVTGEHRSLGQHSLSFC